ncbi:MAG: hypothetical protein J5832_05955, partial [Clostridia bacterium]|nr:hypothetical protein [Clostridia bacterium]
MKKLLKVLVTIMIAVAFVLPTAVVVHADDEFNTLTTTDNVTSIDETKGFITFSGTGTAIPISVSSLKGLLTEKDNEVRKIVAYSSADVKYEDEANSTLKTGDKIKIESADGQTVYREYRFILKGDTNKDGLVNIDDYAQVVQYQKQGSLTDACVIAALYKDSSANVYVTGSDSIETGAGDYTAVVSFGAASTATTVSYIEFTLQYPTFFVFSDYTTTSDMNGWTVNIQDIGSYKLKISAYKEDFNGAAFDNSSTPAKRIANLEFTLVAATQSGTEGSFKEILSSGKGVSNRGGTVGVGGIEKFVTVGTATPTAPTLNTKNDASITLNSVIGYQYYCSTSSEAPAADSEYWATASGATITFSPLSSGTVYYIFYRRNATEQSYKMEDSIKTDDPLAIPGPHVESSDTSSITVAFSSDPTNGTNFTGIYFSPNSAKPTLNSTWITLDSKSNSIAGVGTYTVDKVLETVTFSGLSAGKFYITGRTSNGVISSATVWAPTPNYDADDITVNSDSVELPYAAIYKYSLDGKNYYLASTNTKTYMSTGGTIYIQRETVNGNPNVAVIHGLQNDKEYMVYIQVFDNSEPASAVCQIAIKTGASTPAVPPTPVPKANSQIYIALEYNKSLNYRINNSSWTASFATYPTETNMITLGEYAYYFDNSTNPTHIVFAKLKPNTTYKIDVKFATDPTTTTNISSVTTKTVECKHIYGEKQYIGNTLKYTQTCTICGDIKSGEDTPTHVHTYETITVPSTCVTHGYTYQKCSGCNAILEGSRVELPLAAHTEVKRVKTHATCTTYGTVDVVCSVCGAVIRENEPNLDDPPKGHQFETITDYTAPTCTAHGHERIYQKCSVCGVENLISERDIAALGHDAAWVVTVEPTATSEGRKDYICSRCGEVLDSEVIAKLISYIKNTNGTGTYEIEVDNNKALVSDAAKLAIADGDASVKVVFPGGVSVELDPAMAVAFLRNGSYLNVKKITSATEASGDLAKAGFDPATCTVYEITAENAVIANGKATVTLKYQATAEGGAVNVYFVDAQGKKTKMTSHYENG